MCVDAAVWGCMGNGDGILCGSADPVSGSSLSMESAKASKIDGIQEYIEICNKKVCKPALQLEIHLHIGREADLFL